MTQRHQQPTIPSGMFSAAGPTNKPKAGPGGLFGEEVPARTKQLRIVQITAVVWKKRMVRLRRKIVPGILVLVAVNKSFCTVSVAELEQVFGKLWQHKAARGNNPMMAFELLDKAVRVSTISQILIAPPLFIARPVSFYLCIREIHRFLIVSIDATLKPSISARVRNGNRMQPVTPGVLHILLLLSSWTPLRQTEIPKQPKLFKCPALVRNSK
jgi:hypothetical protein